MLNTLGLTVPFSSFIVYYSAFIFQCAMCRTGAESGGEASLAQGLNVGILVLLVPPAVIFCAFFWLALRGEIVTGSEPPMADARCRISESEHD